MIFTNNNSTYEDHEFWNESRIKIFETLLNMTPVSACWQRKHLKKALLIISSELSITKKFALSEIIELLEYGKENNFFDHQISIRSFHKQHRHTVLNSLLNNSEHLEATQNLYKGIWEKYLTRNLEVDDLLLPLICTMLHDNAFGANITPQLIYQVKICDVTVDQAFILPLTADDTSKYCSKVELACSTRLILSRILRGRHNNKHTDYLFIPEISDINLRKKALGKKLEEQYNNLLLKVKINPSNRPKLNIFFKLLSQTSLWQGIPPCLLTLNSQTLPATGQWDDYKIYFSKSSASISKSQKFKNRKLNLYKTKCAHPIIVPKPGENPSITTDWNKRASSILSQFRDSLSNLNIKNISDKFHKNKIIKIKNHYLNIANSIAYQGSALHLAIEWSVYKIIYNNTNEVSSLRTYHYQIFSKYLFLLKNAERFSSKDLSDQSNELINNLNERQLSPNTAEDFISNIFSVYNYGYRNGYLNEIHIDITFTAFRKSKRSVVLWPSTYDSKIKVWRSKNDFHYNLLAIAADLAYYGDLRENEIFSLEIGDIRFNGKVCEIFIFSGKTNNSPRIIPYHLSAPSENVNYLHEIWILRNSLSPKNKTAKFFGPDNKDEDYSEKTISDELSCGLKNTFGDTFTPHMLRHCFTNNLIIKLFALDDSNIFNYIPDKEHEIFSTESMNKLSRWVYNETNRNKLGKEHTTLWYMAKLLGHSSPEEGLTTYGHIYSYLLKPYIFKINDIIDESITLTRDATALLLPNMSSSRTLRKKYKIELTISEAAEISWNNI